MLFAFIFILLILLAVFYYLYISLIKKKNTLKNALSGIEVQFAKRADLIPEILTIVQRYITHEKNMMEEITKLRSKMNELKKKNTPNAIEGEFELSNLLEQRMTNLFALAENYPDLKANKSLEKTMDIYHDIEENIAAARRFYNSAVEELNNACEIFPSSFVAGLINIKPYPFFEAAKGADKRVKAADYIK